MSSILTLKNLQKIPKKSCFPWKTARLLILIAGGVALLFIIGVFAYFAKDLPSPGKISSRVVVESTKIYDRTGDKLLYDIHGEEKRTVIPLAEIPDVVKYATIALEDQDFYEHHGIKFTSIARAAIKNLLDRGVQQGGSTITQQFIKNSVLSPERTFTRKIKEVILSLELEQKFSKDEILEMYLNEIPYGSNAYGVEAAAQTFFGKHARELSLDEATLLASLPKAPTYYSPYGSRPEELKARQEFALEKMAAFGYISFDQSAQATSVDVMGKVMPNRENIYAPHFVISVREYLEEKYGRDAVEKGGLKVYTTLDWQKQEVAERVVKEGADKNLKSWRAENAALVAIDPKMGQVLAMVGSKDFFDTTIDGQVNVAIRDRQPGSSFKPYVYLTAFSKGYTPDTILFDVETEFDTDDGKEYKPQNYDGKFRGPLKMKEALAMSLNIPAVKTLYLAGMSDAITMAKRMGITGLNHPDRYGLSLVLGGGEVRLLDHTAGFATLATGGVRHTPALILRVEDAEGATLEEFVQTEGERVVEEKYVAALDHILSTNAYRESVFGKNNPLRFDDRPVAAKTGTTNEFRDGWTMGYTPSITVGVWAGNNDNRPMMPGADGVNVAAPIWRAFLDAVLPTYAVESFPHYEKEGVGKDILDGKIDEREELRVCEIPGKNDAYCIANKYCPDNELKKRSYVAAHTILWYVKKDAPRGETPKDPSDDPQFKNWEKGVQKWYEKEKDYSTDAPPDEECKEDDFEKYKPSVTLSAPDTASTQDISLSASVDAPYGVDKVTFRVDGGTVAERSGAPYNVTYTIPLSKNGGALDVQVTVVDRNGNETHHSRTVSVSF